MFESCGCEFDLDGALLQIGAFGVARALPMLRSFGVTLCRRLVSFGRSAVPLRRRGGLLEVRGWLARVIGLPLLCRTVTQVGCAVTLIGCSVTLVGRTVAHIGDPVAVVGDPVPLVRYQVARIPELLLVACRGSILRNSEPPPRRLRPFACREVARLAALETLSGFDGTAQGGVPTLRTSRRALNRLCLNRLFRSVALAGTATHERILFAVRCSPNGGQESRFSIARASFA